MLAGVLYALAAGLLWGLVFVVPLLLPDASAWLLSAGRYLAFGLLALPLAWFDRRALRGLTRADWRCALALAAVGNLLYYLLLAAAIQRAGAPLPTMIIGTLPVVIAVAANAGAGRGAALPWTRLAPSLLLLAAGILLVERAELAPLPAAGAERGARLQAALLAAGAVACWTWYPLRNARWLRAHPDCSARAWASAQGLATLPLAAAALAIHVAATGSGRGGAASAAASVLGAAPGRFVLLMLASGLLASWLGTLCWNAASRRLPTALAGQLIVFETLAALGYAYALRGHWPPAPTLAGVALLVAGVWWALRSGAAAGRGAAQVV